MSNVQFQTVKAWPARGIVAMIGVMLATIGAIGLWGVYAGFFTIGVIALVDACTDEVVERVTLIRRVP